ncbi:unnamed protein product [Bursaphelenchus okinawaensis]|uniref:GRIP domain-containing protein n=1 Tax=Bursaphelenchus okinawaensis TaxID=465554 RepID=A0A811LQ31_9BILA|nr:unnamed protein product [Bursaphelenchus okinawaensis]CAG9125387.1 unnamed protein product [Bursaphelenchus okinawaensis]
MTEGEPEALKQEGNDQNEGKKSNKLDALPRESLINLLKKQVTITKDLKKQLTTAKEEADGLREQLGSQKPQEDNDTALIQLELLDYKKSLEQLKKKYEASEATLKQKDSLLDEVVEKMKSLTEQNVALEDEKQKVTLELNRLAAEIQEKDELLQENGKNADDLKKMSDEKEKKIENEISELEETIVRQTKVLEEVRKELKDTKEENLNLVRVNHRFQDDLDLVKNEFKKYKERAEFLLNSSTEQNQRQATDGFELEEMERQLGQKDIEISDLNEKIRHMQHELHSQKERTLTLKSELEDSRMSISFVQKDFNEQRKQLVAEYDERTKTLAFENERLKDSVNDLKEKLATNNQRPTNFDNSQIIELNKEINRLTNELMEYKQKEESSDRTITKQQETNSKKSVPNPINFNFESYYNKHQNPQTTSEPFASPEEDLVKSLKNVIDGVDDVESCSTFNLDAYSVDDSFLMEPELAMKQMENMKELLKDTEETNAKLEDQVRLLKEEIRRSERDKEREKHVSSNSEYLKNVVLKFLAPEKVNDGRSQLLPVLCTLLSLTPQEKQKIEEYLKSQNVSNTTPPPSEWSGYFGPLSGIF